MKGMGVVKPDSIKEEDLDQHNYTKAMREALGDNPLAAVSTEVRSLALRDMDRKERVPIMNNLVQSAMVMGLMEVEEIRHWLGEDKKGDLISSKLVENAKERVLERWKEESSKIDEEAFIQRARLIRHLWQDVRKIEKRLENDLDDDTQIKWMKLKRDYLQDISKIGFVDSLAEDGQAQPVINILQGTSVNGSTAETGEAGEPSQYQPVAN
jgi:hypothetical protein